MHSNFSVLTHYSQTKQQLPVATQNQTVARRGNSF